MVFPTYGIVSVFNFVHPARMALPISLTLPGITKELTEVCANAKSPIAVNVSSKVIVLISVAYSNARASITDTSPRSTLVNIVAYANAP